MMNEAPDLERKKIALLTSIADGRVITDANATTDERMMINSMLDQYITKSGDPKLAALATGTLPGSPFARKLRAVQTALGIGVDGLFGEDSMLGLVRAGGRSAESIEDVMKDVQRILDAGNTSFTPQPTAAELGAMIVQDKKSIDLGRPLSAPGTGSSGVKIGSQNLTPAQLPVLKSILRNFSAEELEQIRKTAVTMERGGKASLPFIQSKLGVTAAGGAMQAQVLLDYLGIKPGDGSSSVPKLTPVTPAPTRDVDYGSGRLIPERKRYRS